MVKGPMLSDLQWRQNAETNYGYNVHQQGTNVHLPCTCPTTPPTSSKRTSASCSQGSCTMSTRIMSLPLPPTPRTQWDDVLKVQQHGHSNIFTI